MDRYDRKTAEVILGDGFKARIAERDAYHILTIMSLSDRSNTQDPVGISYVSVTTVGDALRSGLIGMSKFRPKYWRIRRRARVKWLLKHHTQKMLNVIMNKVYEVEGVDVKKKLSDHSEPQSEEKSADV